jgi:ceramide glucosyltransferase
LSAVALTLYALAALTGTSCVYFLLTAIAALRSRAASRAASAGPARRPSVSILVPVCGAEPRLEANLEALLAALEPGDELLVGAASKDDPALTIASGLAARNPALQVVAGSPSRATNRKIATLSALEPRATRDVIVLVDSDVRLDRDLLARLVSPLGDRTVGIATALYRGEPAPGLASRLEALTINADFVPSVLVAHVLGGGIRFALGAANAVTREALAAIGGFASLGEVLADDHHLGRRIALAGKGVRIAPVCVPIVQDSSPRDTFARLLRWCRTYRVCQPTGYAATVLSHHGVACSLAALAVAAIDRSPLLVPCAVLAAATIAWRVVTAAVAHVAIAGRGADLLSFPLLPLRDLVGTLLFLLAWTGRSVTWRGRRFRVAPDGVMTELASGRALDETKAAPLAAPGGS